MAKKKKIELFSELYAYFAKHDKKYFMEELLDESMSIISVNLIGSSGEILRVVKLNPTEHEQLCKYIFRGVEVSRPELTIDQVTIKVLVKTLLLSPNIFKNPPNS